MLSFNELPEDDGHDDVEFQFQDALILQQGNVFEWTVSDLPTVCETTRHTVINGRTHRAVMVEGRSLAKWEFHLVLGGKMVSYGRGMNQGLQLLSAPFRLFPE